MKKVIEKIKKLMAMAADGSSPNEAAAAARRVRAMMDKHQLSMKDFVESDGFDTATVGASRKFMAKWEQGLAVRVAELNDCVVAFAFEGEYKRLQFKGFESDVIICKYMISYLIENGKRCCSKYMRDMGYTKYNAAVGSSFKLAYAGAVGRKLREMLADRQPEQGTGTSLILRKKALVEQKFGAAKYGRSAAADNGGYEAASAGHRAGENTNINTAVGGGTKIDAIA